MLQGETMSIMFADGAEAPSANIMAMVSPYAPVLHCGFHLASLAFQEPIRMILVPPAVEALSGDTSMMSTKWLLAAESACKLVLLPVLAEHRVSLESMRWMLLRPV